MILPQAVAKALKKLEGAGYPSYVVGGAVRDALRGQTPHDFDLCTAATPQQMHQVFQAYSIVDTGLAHGTITVHIEHHALEITTFRVENTYSDGRHPDDIRFVREIEADLARRDFTINAMAYSPLHGLIDPFGGQRDLERHILRAVGDAVTRFEEDGLRILRGLRFAARFGFTFTPDTERAMYEQMQRLNCVSAERIAAELLPLLCGRYAGCVLREYTEIIGVVLPEIPPMKGFAQRNTHHRYDVLEHTLRMLEQIPADPILRLTALYHDVGKLSCMTIDDRGVGHFYGHPQRSAEMVEVRCRALRLSRDMRETVVFLVKHHDLPIPIEERIIRRRLAQFGEQRLRQLLMIKRADGVGRGTHLEYMEQYQRMEQMVNRVVAQKSCLTVRSLALDGKALMRLGLSGPQIGVMQRRLLEWVLDHPAENTEEALTVLVRQQMEDIK